MKRMMRMMRMKRKQRKTRTMAAPIRLSSQILMKPQENEEPSRTRRTKPDEPGEDEGKGEGDQDEEKKKLKRRNLPTTVKSEINQIMTIDAGSFGASAVLGKRRPRNPARRMNQNLPLRRRTVSISERLHAKQSQ